MVETRAAWAPSHLIKTTRFNPDIVTVHKLFLNDN